jgi:dihydroorotate dehydrogenase (fumarate)
MITSALLRHGVAHMQTLLEGLSSLLVARRLESLDQIRGRMSQRSVKDPPDFERANYRRVLHGFRSMPGAPAT